MSAASYQLFDELPPAVPGTEGIKYTGSKRKLIGPILRLAHRVGAASILDGFAGSTRVSQAFAAAGLRVVCNDIAVWSETFGRCYLKARPAHHYRALIDELNSVLPFDGWFTENYGGSPNAEAGQANKKPWQIHNTRKLDAIRHAIEQMGLSEDERAVALTSLILALDKVDSTIGHFSSYLKEWSSRSYNELKLVVPAIATGRDDHEVFRASIFETMKNVSADLSYFDPPYGSNNEKMPPSRVRYSAYYHVWTTVILNDQPDVFGKANRRTDTRDTVNPNEFEEYRRGGSGRFIAVEAIERLLQQANSPHIILSYSSGGRATADELNDVIANCGRIIEVIEVSHSENVMAGMSWTNEWLRDAKSPHREFLFLIEKS